MAVADDKSPTDRNMRQKAFLGRHRIADLEKRSSLQRRWARSQRAERISPRPPPLRRRGFTGVASRVSDTRSLPEGAFQHVEHFLVPDLASLHAAIGAIDRVERRARQPPDEARERRRAAANP